MVFAPSMIVLIELYGFDADGYLGLKVKKAMEPGHEFGDDQIVALARLESSHSWKGWGMFHLPN